MKKAIHDCITGEVIIIDMPDEEAGALEAEWEKNKSIEEEKSELEILKERISALEQRK